MDQRNSVFAIGSFASALLVCVLLLGFWPDLVYWKWFKISKNFRVSPETPKVETPDLVGGKVILQGPRTAEHQMADLHLQTSKQQIDEHLIDQLLTYQLKLVKINQLLTEY